MPPKEPVPYQAVVEEIVAENEVKNSENGKTIIYRRTKVTDNSTIGSFTIPGTDITGYFLKSAGPSTTTANLDRRIPAGTYNLEWNTGTKYPNALRLYNDQVSRSRAILIHIGNYSEDTKGCLLPGCSTGKNAVWSSATKFNQIINHFNTAGIDGAKIIIYCRLPKQATNRASTRCKARPHRQSKC